MRYVIALVLPLVGIMLVSSLFVPPLAQTSSITKEVNFIQSDSLPGEYNDVADTMSGTLNPVLIQHIGTAAGTPTYFTGRTDVTPSISAEAFLPAGSVGNLYSADCTGGHFLVGTGGSTSFASAEGTISLWLKFDVTAPNGRFWGQHADLETRWSSNRLVLDWGSDTTLQGTKSDWLINHWYFIAITWNQGTNTLAIYWGDEENQPTEDASTASWTGTIVGLLSENNIMSSRASTSYRVDGHVDDFRYYTLERELGELQTDYKTSLTGSESGLSHYYRFENSLEDSSGGAALISSGSYSFSRDVITGDNGWKAEQVEIQIRNLEQLCALYGSFESGAPGTNVDWFGDGAFYAEGWRARREYIYTPGRQRTIFTTTAPRYLVIENEGYEVTSPNGYRHYNGTTIYWYQVVDNAQNDTQFEFSMNYLYQRGPIGYNYTGNFEFGFEILNGSTILWNWSLDPTNISQRGIWYNTGSLLVDLPQVPSTFEVRAILRVHTFDSYVQIAENDLDLDGDSANGMYVSFLMDDVSLTALEKPSPDDVDLEVHFDELGNVPIHGESGIGSILLNHSYWEQASIPCSFTSNTTISFEYAANVQRMTRFFNSSYSTSLDNEGVAYDVELGRSVNLHLFTYIQSYSEARDIGFKIHYPHDWYNPIVVDPFGNNVTSQLIIGTNFAEIPSGIASLVGWWSVRLSGPNYVSSVSIQAQRATSLVWEDATICRSGDRVRCVGTIGHDSELTGDISDFEFNWYQPTGGVWWSETLDEFNDSAITTEGTTLGPYNASIGMWSVTLSWSNGTEVAYDFASFELRHELIVFAQTPSIEIEPGDEFTAAIFIYDQDNGNPILDGASAVGNWTTGDISFSPNLAKGWWEADFNSSAIGTGDFVLMVIVTMPYYEVGTCSINVNIPAAESLFIITLRASLFGALAVFALFVVISISRHFYEKASTSRNLALLSLKGRIEDSRTLIGVLVIHRSIGLPIYSRIIKGGFQESILSSFITALSQFRAEFSWDEPRWTAIPITEVITAVQTEVLICAMITVETSSERQKRQLEAFGKDIGALYDLDNGEMKKIVNNRTLDESIDPIFDSHFDGALFDRYIGVNDSLPKHLEPVKTAMMGMDLEHGVSPEAIIKAMIPLGYSDRKSHILVLEAIDGNYLIAAERVNPSRDESEG
ncbi:MAG: hypothetical protein ACFFDV_09175 [Candidatus Thorarchaeota archaeon]